MVDDESDHGREIVYSPKSRKAGISRSVSSAARSNSSGKPDIALDPRGKFHPAMNVANGRFPFDS